MGPNVRTCMRWLKQLGHDISLRELAVGVAALLSADWIWFTVASEGVEKPQLQKLDVEITAMMVQFVLCKVVEGIEFVALCKPSVWRLDQRRQGNREEVEPASKRARSRNYCPGLGSGG